MKSGTYFHFKQFSVRDDKCAMKVGTDAVLLAAWVDVSGAQRILDIGTGSGVIALMLAQRVPQSAGIESVEIEKEAADQAAENFRNSPWSSTLAVHHLSIQDYFPAERFDLITTNPPYFNRSLEPPDKKRHRVRHTATLTYDELLSAVARLLTLNGRFNLILPCKEAMLFSDVALRYGFFCSRRYHFRTRKEKPLERTLMELSRRTQSIDEGEILLYESETQWSSSYRNLISDFYIRN
jgi:tRNA1Val (adenine37-N6)-methyltransferase